ncbi:hypothetical protein BH09ACT10_BH09ACT10_08970 [soil metagenome]
MLRTKLIAPAVLVAMVATVFAGAAGWGAVCLLGLLVVVVGEPLLARFQSDVAGTLTYLGMGLPSRILICMGGVALHSERHGLRFVVCLVVLTIAALAVRAAYLFVQRRIAANRKLPVETRNLPLPGIVLPPPAPGLVGETGAMLVGLLAFVPLVAALLVGDHLAALWTVGLVALLAAGAVVAVAAPHARWHVPESTVIKAATEAIRAADPEVVLYFGDNDLAAYQVNMWLATLERLDRPVAVLVRNRKALDAIATTALPIICAPSAVSFMALDFQSVRAALYVANVGNNIHLLREPHIMSTFIGHGDSDKNASANPYAKVYDEIWVAGEAGRRRYEAADVGVRDDAIVFVGRPQLDELTSPTSRVEPISRVELVETQGLDKLDQRETALDQRETAHDQRDTAHDQRDGATRTLLYAPTWEGWNGEQEYGSVAYQGVVVIEAALAAQPPVRVIYKPHPFTGRRDAKSLRAHRRIVAMLEAANVEHGVRQSATYELAAGATSAVEESSRMRDSAAAYFAAQPPNAHLHIDASGPDIFATFQVADVLVADVSSVLSDFLATGKPYAVCNTTDQSEDEFVVHVPAGTAGIVLAKDGKRLDEVIALVTGKQPDIYGTQRTSMHTFSLGDGVAQPRFNAAVAALVARAHSRRTM